MVKEIFYIKTNNKMKEQFFIREASLVISKIFSSHLNSRIQRVKLFRAYRGLRGLTPLFKITSALNKDHSAVIKKHKIIIIRLQTITKQDLHFRLSGISVIIPSQ